MVERSGRLAYIIDDFTSKTVLWDEYPQEGEVRNVKEIERAVDRLSEAEYVEFRHWFLERDWDEWDRQIRTDSDSGKLEFLVREAEEDGASLTIDNL